MIVNGTNIADFGAKQWEVTPGKRAISNESDMFQGSYLPIMAAPDFGLCEYTIKLNVHGDSRAGIWDNVSRILNLFTEVAEVKLDGFADRMFRLSLKDTSLTEYGPQKDRWGILTLKCAGYAHGNEMSVKIKKEDMTWYKNEGKFVYRGFAGDIPLDPMYTHSPKTTTPVPVNIWIVQKRKCESDNGVFEGLAGNYYPLNARFSIRSLYGRDWKEVWKLEGTFAPQMISGEHGIAFPSPSGYGVYAAMIDGQTGQVIRAYNRSEPGEGDQKAYAKMSATRGLTWGHYRQELEIEIMPAYTPPAYEAEAADYEIRFEHTPVYL